MAAKNRNNTTRSKNSNNNNSENRRSNNGRSSTSKNPSGGNSTKPNHSYQHSSNDNNGSNKYDSESYNNSNHYPSKEDTNSSNYNDNGYDSGSNNFSKDPNRYRDDEPINDPPYDDYNSNHGNGKVSGSNNSSYNDNYERNNYSENTTGKQETRYNDNSINDISYNRADNSNSSYNKDENNSNYNSNDNNESYDNYSEDYNNVSDDSGYTSKGGGSGDNNETNNTSETESSNSSSARQGSSRGIRSFIDRFGSVRFRNSNDINRFFAENSSSLDFMHWFKDNIGGRGLWRERSLRNISQQDARSFNMVWDKIPYLFRGRDENYSINLFQFFGLVSIMINEVGSRFTPIRERGSLSYMFNTVIPATARRPERRKTSYNNPRNNMTAYQLFNDEHFLRAHSGMPRYNSIANTRNRAWHGTEYPRGVVTRPSSAGIIAEADFYKFSGRGLIQTTWSRSYIRLIEHTLNYNGNNPIILEYKNEWQQSLNQHGSLRIIASQTKNRDWDRLFMETQNEFACIAVYKFQEHRDHFLEEIEVNANRLQGNGIGSLYYIGYKVGGRSSYGNKVKGRCLQMINKLLEHRRN